MYFSLKLPPISSGTQLLWVTHRSVILMLLPHHVSSILQPWWAAANTDHTQHLGNGSPTDSKVSRTQSTWLLRFRSLMLSLSICTSAIPSKMWTVGIVGVKDSHCSTVLSFSSIWVRMILVVFWRVPFVCTNEYAIAKSLKQRILLLLTCQKLAMICVFRYDHKLLIPTLDRGLHHGTECLEFKCCWLKHFIWSWLHLLQGAQLHWLAMFFFCLFFFITIIIINILFY